LAYTYPDYSYDWSDNPPPYRPDLWYDYDSSASYLSTPISNDDNDFNLNAGLIVGDLIQGDSGSVQKGQTTTQAAPNSPAPAD